jgi:ribonuclease HII
MTEKRRGSRRAEQTSKPDAATVPTTEIETELLSGTCRVIVGIDEVGRGAWAGPLTVGAVAVGATELRRLPDGVRDSKQLSPQQRESLFEPLTDAVLAYSFGHVSSSECDELGLTRALALAAKRALGSLRSDFDSVMIDGLIDYTETNARCVVRGDAQCALIASASVLAKVTRDEWMKEAAVEHPGYGFEHNKGYVSPGHKAAVQRIGMSPIHRQSWNVALLEPVADDEQTSQV